jgi:thiamine pyrophosphokinase
MSKKFIILANGEIDDPGLLRRRLDPWSQATVIAADAGLQHAKSLRLKVDVLIGDLDSVSEEDKSSAGDHEIQVIEFPVGKDETDLELALIHAANSGAKRIVILGALGGRLDMSLANILLLTRPQLAGIHAELWADHQTAWLIRPPGEEISGEPGDTISLIPLLDDATGISTTNLAYAMSDSTLQVGEVRGMSNVLTNQTARIDLGGGTILVVHTPGRA